MTATAPVPRKTKVPRIKRIDISSYTGLKHALERTEDDLRSARAIANELVESAETIVREAEARIKAHLLRTDLRPALIYKRQPKVITIALNSVIYRYGPKSHIDPEDPTPVFWERVENGQIADRGEAGNLHDALVACLKDFCREMLPEDEDVQA